MKKLFYAVIAAMIVLSVTDCNEGGVKPPAEPPSKLAKIDSELYDYLHIKTDEKGVPPGLVQILFTEEAKETFRADSAAFADKYFNRQTPLLNSGRDFTFSVFELYDVMQKKLGITKSKETGIERYNGIRIYPAIENIGGQRQLYLAFMGEKVTAGPLRFNTMLTEIVHDAYTIRSNKVIRVTNPSAQYTQLKSDIQEFQRFWIQNEQAPGRDAINRNMCFSISEYYEMLDLLHKDMAKDTINNGPGKFKITFYPCLTDKKLRLVAKGIKDVNVIPGSSFFNNMDVCPTRCPVNEL
jgi:hypothetical protein